MLKLDIETVIPGHGPVSKRDYLVQYRDNVVKLQNRIGGLVREGKSKDDITKGLMTEFGYAANHAVIIRLDGIMAELK